MQLINKFPTRLPQTTGDVFELHKEIFVESLLEESFDKTQFSDLTDYKCDEEHYAQEQLRQHLDEEKLFLSAQDDTAKTIRVLQESLEKLMDEKSKVNPELRVNFTTKRSTWLSHWG